MRKQTDERILETRRKVSSRGFYILLYGMMLIILYRQFYLDQQFRDYGDFFILWILGCLYVTIRSTLSGLNLFGERKYNFIAVPFVIAATNLGLGLYKGAIESVWEGILSFTVSLATSGVLLYVLFLLYKNWEKRNIEQ